MALPKGVPDIGKIPSEPMQPKDGSFSASHEAADVHDGKPPVMDFRIPSEKENYDSLEKAPIAGHENPGAPSGGGLEKFTNNGKEFKLKGS